MTVIAPAVLCETESDYKTSIERLAPFAKRVHIDLTDGQFAPTFTVGVDKLWWPQEWTVDIHAMVTQPSQHIEQLIALKPHLVIFHVEAGENLIPHMQRLKQVGIKAGVALLKTTVPSTVKEYIEVADHVMIFTGTLGKYGGEASMMQLEKVRLVRGIHPEVEIGWDGGANVENVYGLSQGTVDVVNVGGAISKADDPAAMYTQLVNEINKHGVI